MNSDGRFGKWSWDVSFRTSDIKDIINKHSNQSAPVDKKKAETESLEAI